MEYAFNLIWEACSNMERYVQYGFKIPSRNLIFGKDNWDRLMFNSIDEISKELIEIDTPESPSGDIQEQSIENIIDAAPVKEPKPAGGEPTDRFNSVINFSNFLLHVLRLQTTNDVALDDKRLIELFDPYINTTDKEKRLTFVKEFGFNILRCKFLFDKYVIKREYLKGTDRWSLKKVKWYNGNQVSYVNTFGDKNGIEGENREILMLLAMFHVSTPTLVYKHWLNASLRYVFENNDITPNGYKTYLENLAKAFLYDRYIALTPIEYFDIIYTNNGIAKNTEVDESKLDQGTAVENFIFNYLDFLLWKKHKSIFDDFEYSFRSSVEHYYPQNPIEPTQRIDNVHLDKFGNLCLISNSKNSRLSNYMPQAKKDHYQSSKTIDSIKQRLMMNFDNWNINEICEHGAEMKRLLMHDIQPNLGAAAQILT